MLPCIQLTRHDGALINQPVYDIRHIIEDTGNIVELIRITTRVSLRLQTDFDTVVSKSFLDLVPFGDASVGGRRTALNRRYVREMFRLGDGQAKIVLINGESFYPVEDYDTLSPLFEATSGSPGSGGGEVNTMSNLSGGTGLIFAQKSGVEFQLRSLVEGTNISFGLAANTITINSTASGSGINRTVLSAGAMSMVVFHDSTFPAPPPDHLVQNAVGDFTLTIPAEMLLFGFAFIGGPGHHSGGTMKIEIIDTDGKNYYLMDKILMIGNKTASDQHSGLATFYSYDFTVSGVQFTWNNMTAYNPDGFVMMNQAFSL
jgi:hypothetical protein